MKIFNMRIYKSDLRFYPDEMKNKIELTLAGDNDLILNFTTSNDANNMIKFYNIFNIFSINELQGKYCRAYYNEETKQVDYIKDIVYDYGMKIEKMKE
jgi:hypothetical protein